MGRSTTLNTGPAKLQDYVREGREKVFDALKDRLSADDDPALPSPAWRCSSA